MKPYDVPPLFEPDGEEFRQVNVVTFFGTDGDAWVLDPARMRRGGRTDFASSPRLSVWLVPKFGRLTPAARWHDWACEDGIPSGLVSPVDADGMFRSIMRRDGVPRLLRALAWCGVRWGAAGNPARRPGWWSTFWPVLGLSIVALPIMSLAALGITVGLSLYSVTEWLLSVLFGADRESAAGLST